MYFIISIWRQRHCSIDRVPVALASAGIPWCFLLSFFLGFRWHNLPPIHKKTTPFRGEKYANLAVRYAKLHSCSDVDYWSPPANVLKDKSCFVSLTGVRRGLFLRLCARAETAETGSGGSSGGGGPCWVEVEASIRAVARGLTNPGKAAGKGRTKVNRPL